MVIFYNTVHETARSYKGTSEERIRNAPIIEESLTSSSLIIFPILALNIQNKILLKTCIKTLLESTFKLDFR